MTDLNDVFAAEVEDIATPADEVAVRRWVGRAQAMYENWLVDPAQMAAVSERLDRFDAAEQALHAGREAEARGAFGAAVAEYERAAEMEIGDAALRLAYCHVQLGDHRTAVRYCEQAEAEGFAEARDLAVRCYAELGETPPARVDQLPEPDHEPHPPRPEPSSGPRRLSGGSADPGLTRRLKALACTVPLHDLDARKAMLDWLDPGVYQMSEIALHVIDLVTIAMDFDRGATHDDIVERVVPFIASQAPERDAREHERVARWVMEKLINVGTVDRGFRRVYGEIDVDGNYHRMLFDFKLVQEVAGPRGRVLLRASDEAITVLIGALDTDVESAQIAAEVKLQNLIDRGRLADARLAAEQARYRTVQYGEALRKRLDATRRDVLLVDWEHELPQMLNDALDHVEDRLRVEHTIHATITEARDTSDEPEHKRHAAELVAVVEDCLRRHMQLQARLLTARSVFRTEQDRQQFSGPPQRSAINLHGQLLRPLLDTPVSDAVGPVSAFFRAVGGLSAPEVVTLPTLVSTLLRSIAEPVRTAGPVVHADPPGVPVDLRFTEEHWRLADHLLDLPGRIRSLSDLVREASHHDPELPVLIALRAGHALAPAIQSARARGVRHVLVAVPAGSTFDSPNGAASGDELLITTAEIAEDIPDVPGEVA